MRYPLDRVAGLLIFLGSTQFVFGLTLAEISYYRYSNVFQGWISDLQATCYDPFTAATCLIYQPSATIFNTSSVLFAVLLIFSSYFIYRTFRARLFSGCLLLSGAGFATISLFPEISTSPVINGDAFLLVYICGSLSAVLAYRLVKPPFTYLSLALGLIPLALLPFALGFQNPVVSTLGEGGLERMIAYPILLWLLAFGTYLMKG